jgi:hypothetical protein
MQIFTITKEKSNKSLKFLITIGDSYVNRPRRAKMRHFKDIFRHMT